MILVLQKIQLNQKIKILQNQVLAIQDIFGKDSLNRAPDELIPLDFTPIYLPYPDYWKKMFGTKGFLIAMHVPISFVKDKNRITRTLYHIAKTGINIKKNEISLMI